MPNQTNKDPWDTDTGLPDDFDFFITSAYFGYRQEYMDGEVPLLIWQGESPDEDIDEIIWPCGSNWEVVKGGEAVEHPKRNRFVKTSLYGKLIDRVVKELGLREEMEKRGDPKEAAVWKGLGFHMKREDIEYGSGILEDRGGKTTHLMPVAVLEKPAKGKAKTEATETTTEAKEKPSAAALEKKLALLAAKLSREDFQAKAMDMPEVVADDDLLASILDDSESGFWAKHQK